MTPTSIDVTDKCSIVITHEFVFFDATTLLTLTHGRTGAIATAEHTTCGIVDAEIEFFHAIRHHFIH